MLWFFSFKKFFYTPYLHWLFSPCKYTQDIEIFDLENFKYNFVNMTAFRIVDSTNTMVRHILSDIERFQPSGYSILNKTYVIQVNGPHCTISLIAISVPPLLILQVSYFSSTLDRWSCRSSFLLLPFEPWRIS